MASDISKNVCKLRTLPCLSTHPHRYPSLIGRFRRSADEPIPYLTFSHYYFIFRISIYSYLIIIFVSIFLNLRIRDRCFVPVTAFVLCRPADQMPDEIREAHRREALARGPNAWRDSGGSPPGGPGMSFRSYFWTHVQHTGRCSITALRRTAKSVLFNTTFPSRQEE